LGQAHALGRLDLGEASFANGFGDFKRQPGFDLEPVCIGQAQIGEYIAGTGLEC